MIVEWFLSLGAGIAEWFLSLFGDASPPDWLDDVAAFIVDALERGSGLGAWVPFPLLGTVAVVLLGFWAVFWIVKGIRWLWGLTPFSGGS